MSIVMKIKTAAKCIVPVLVLATLSATAAAADVKRSPATMCRGMGGGSLKYYWTGTVANMSKSTDADVICPIVWEDATGSGNIYATVINFHPSLYLSCAAESFNDNDYSIGDMTTNGTYYTDWMSLSLGYHSAPTNGYTVIRCTIPVCSGNDACGSGATWPSGVASYRVQ